MSKRSKSSSFEVNASAPKVPAELVAEAPPVATEVPPSEPVVTEALPAEPGAPTEVPPSEPVVTEAAPAEPVAPTEATRKPTKLNAEAGAEFPFGAGNGSSVAELLAAASNNVAPSFNTTLEDYNRQHPRELNASGNGGVRTQKPMTLPRAGGFGGVKVNTATGEYTVTGDGVFDPCSNAGENHDFAGEIARLNAQAAELLRDLYTPISHNTDADGRPVPVLKYGAEGSPQWQDANARLLTLGMSIKYQQQQAERVAQAKAQRDAQQAAQEAEDREYEMGRQEFINAGRTPDEMAARRDAFDKAALEAKARSALEFIAQRQAAYRRG